MKQKETLSMPTSMCANQYQISVIYTFRSAQDKISDHTCPLTGDNHEELTSSTHPRIVI